MFWQKEKKIEFFYECLAILDFLGKWLLKCLKKAAFKENEFAARVICEDRSMDAWEQDEDSCHEMSALLSKDSFRLDVPREESPLDKETCHEMLKSRPLTIPFKLK